MAERLARVAGGPAARHLLILDEAHHAAPSSGERYGIETKFTRAALHSTLNGSGSA